VRTAEPLALQDLSNLAVTSFSGCEDARLRELLESLVRHLHAFATDVRLSQSEWQAAIEILADTGRITDEHRQEFILWSDTLGISSLVDALANPKPAGATEPTILGPFYVPDAPRRDYGDSLAAHPAGTPAWVHGTVKGLEAEPIAGAEIDVWQNGDDRLYAVQNPGEPEEHLRGRFLARDDGTYAFLGARPVPYPISDDGPVGRMLAATGRHPWRPAHIHMIVRAPGYETLTTHIFDSESEYLGSDAVFAFKPSLVRDFVSRSGDDPARPNGVQGEWCSVRNDIVLAPNNSIAVP
jgi:protocatechuate 3,4-dioxygenase beta subunit